MGAEVEILNREGREEAGRERAWSPAKHMQRHERRKERARRAIAAQDRGGRDVDWT
jgi:hypothetical protein